METDTIAIPKIKIYTITNIHGPRKKDGAGMYILEYETKKGNATLTGTMKMSQTTENQAELLIVKEALKRITKTCEIVIFTRSGYVRQGFLDWCSSWVENDWKNAKGKAVANAIEWQETLKILGESVICEVSADAHAYSKWLEREIGKL